MKDRFIAYDAYRKLAEKYAEIIDTKPHNAEYERPGLLKLMPPVQGKRVLDAGCGSGSLTQWLLDRGAEVIGLDASPHMMAQARKRVQDKADLRLHDLRDPLNFIGDNSLDLVASSLVMHYIDEVEPVFREFHRVLKPGGLFVFSIEHPLTGFVNRPSDSYYDVNVVTYDWTGFTDEPVPVPGYRRPLEGYTESLACAGFYIERLTEPAPTERFKDQLPESYARHMAYPLFMVIRARASK
jgi:SAM-dependent methyltransferase